MSSVYSRVYMNGLVFFMNNLSYIYTRKDRHTHSLFYLGKERASLKRTYKYNILPLINVVRYKIKTKPSRYMIDTDRGVYIRQQFNQI